MPQIAGDISKVLKKKGKFNLLYVGTEGDLKDEDLLLNARTEKILDIENLTCIYTDDGDVYLIPKEEEDEYLSKKGNIIKLPKDNYKLENWLRTSSTPDSETLKLVGEDYVITDKFKPASDDDELTILAKNTMNQLIPIVIKIQGKSDKTWYDARVKEIEKNTISAKMFLLLCKFLNLHVDMRVYREEHEGEPFKEQHRKLI